MKADFMLKGGYAPDFQSGALVRRDVLIKDGRIVSREGYAAAETLWDVSGFLVLPGLVDFHSHFFYGGSQLSVSPSASMLPYGVTAAVDAGTSGEANFRLFLSSLEREPIRAKLFLNVSPAGMSSAQFHEPILPEKWDLKRFQRAFREGAGRLLGLKLRLSREVVGRANGFGVLEKALELAHALSTRLCVHVTNTDMDQARLLRMLRPGDIYCHMYQGLGETLLEDGGVCGEAFRAKERGVLFDASHGKNNFSNESARRALKAGLFPDVISSDISAMSFLEDGAGYGLPYVLSKFLALGMKWEDALSAVTKTPAGLMGMEGEIGSLSPGALADIAVFQYAQRESAFADATGDIVKGKGTLLPAATFLEGKLVYENPCFWGRFC